MSTEDLQNPLSMNNSWLKPLEVVAALLLVIIFTLLLGGVRLIPGADRRLCGVRILEIFDDEALVQHDSQRSLQSWIRIAAGAAKSDVEMQRRDPESQRLATVTDQLATRHWALRLTRRILGGPIAGRFAIGGALGAGLLFHAIRADRMAFAAVSVVRDLTYWRSLQDALPQQALEAV